MFKGLDELIKKLQNREDLLRSLNDSVISEKRVALDSFLHSGKDEDESAKFEADNKEVFDCMRKVTKLTGDKLK